MIFRSIRIALIALCLSGCNGGGSSSDSADTQPSGSTNTNTNTNTTNNNATVPLSWGSAKWGEGATWGGQ